MKQLDDFADNVHVFEQLDLNRLGTHSFKRSAVTMLKDAQHSTAVIAGISGTAAGTLDSTYDAPTTRRKQKAMQSLDAVWQGMPMQGQASKRKAEQADCYSPGVQADCYSPGVAKRNKGNEQKVQYCNDCGCDLRQIEPSRRNFCVQCGCKLAM
eukprot:3598875-Amphidinium_carterae.1